MLVSGNRLHWRQERQVAGFEWTLAYRFTPCSEAPVFDSTPDAVSVLTSRERLITFSREHGPKSELGEGQWKSDAIPNVSRNIITCFPPFCLCCASALTSIAEAEDSSYPIQEGLILNSHIFNLLTLDKGRSDCVYWIELDPIGLNGARRGKVLVLGIEVDLHCPC